MKGRPLERFTEKHSHHAKNWKCEEKRLKLRLHMNKIISKSYKKRIEFWKNKFTLKKSTLFGTEKTLWTL